MMYTNYEDLPVLVKMIRSHLVLLFDNKSGESGSGVLVSINDHIFVLTASHVLFKNLHANLGLPFQTTPFSILNKWFNEDLDIGFIELKPFEVDILSIDNSRPFYIGKKNKTIIYAKDVSTAICGYPSEHRFQKENRVGFIPAFLGCRLLIPGNWPRIVKDHGKTGEKNIVIPFGKKHGGTFFDINNEPLNSIEPKGLSGCGIWYFIPSDKNSSEPRYALLGILTSYFRQSQVIVGTALEPLIEELNKKYGFVF